MSQYQRITAIREEAFRQRGNGHAEETSPVPQQGAGFSLVGEGESAAIALMYTCEKRMKRR